MTTRVDSSLPFKILYEDTHLVVLSKPTNLLSQSDMTGDKSLVDYCREYFGRHYVGLVHRLDRNTSGLMVVAKRSKAAERLTESLQNGDLIRRYQAVVVGDWPHEGELVLRHFLLKNEKTNHVTVYDSSSASLKEAVLRGHLLKKINHPLFGTLSILEIELETGRSHQIRAQLAHIGFPIFGDSKYSKTQTSTRPWLHSSYLKFTHPIKAGPATGSSLEPLSATQRILEFKEDIDLNF